LMFSLIPGMGQIYNKQYGKGALFFLFGVSFIIVFYDLFNIGFWGLFTLGTMLPRDNSVFLLAKGIIALLTAGFGIGFYVLMMRDAFINGKKRDQGVPLHSIRAQYHQLIDQGFPYLMSTPAFFLLLFSVVFPIMFSFALAFTNYDLYHSPPANLIDWVGIKNFQNIFSIDIWRDTFIDVLGWTVVWTLAASTLQCAIGIFLAVLLNQKDLKGKRFFRTILILPWAVPGFVTILVFAGLFNDTFGAINNTLFASIGIDPKPWLTDPFWSKIALIAMQTWLGFPFVFIMTTGVLQAIPEDLYEAATIDGANFFQKFRSITLPLVLYSIAPILITQYTFNFNNFNIIYLFNGGGPPVAGSTAGGTDILVSWIYKLTMQSSQYALAAAVTILLSIFVIAIALWQFKRTNSFKEEDMM
ncbi:carbohydrate ABC transporter permease, partial [Bacillus safensis]|uniref:carbohydrate ABC transporter permease n=3 Tax=Bacillaceae TaxID=186817 RepID=UPI0022B7D655